MGHAAECLCVGIARRAIFRCLGLPIPRAAARLALFSLSPQLANICKAYPINSSPYLTNIRMTCSIDLSLSQLMSCVACFVNALPLVESITLDIFRAKHTLFGWAPFPQLAECSCGLLHRVVTSASQLSV